jgi:hypothetical protein
MIGCPIKAAYHCPIFLQFLDKNKCKVLKKYKRERRMISVIAIPILKNISSNVE